MIRRLAFLLLLVSTPAAAAPDAARLIARELAERGAYQRAVRLADEVGARLAGTPAAERAVAWALAEMKAAGLKNVHAEPVTVESWRRGGDDHVEIVSPGPRRLRALALGRSPATPEGGLRGDVIEVDSFEALRKLGAKVRGKIVFFNRALPRSRDFDQYGTVGELRFQGASEAGKLGAAAALVRSIGTGAHRLAHTGATFYEPKVTPIPFAALAVEDAELLHRALLRGPVQVGMHLACGMGPKVPSANVVGEIPGRGKPDEVVLVGAHLDSWDVGDGALDDAAGVGIAIETARLLVDAPPRRTLRVVLFMNEEYGLAGAKAYAAAHAGELGRHVAAMEADAGAGAPLGLSVPGTEQSLAIARRLTQVLAPLGVSDVKHTDGTGADLMPLSGVPQVGVRQDASDYFEWHHTDGDTADKIDPDQISRAAATFAAVALQLADADQTLPRLTAPARR